MFLLRRLPIIQVLFLSHEMMFSLIRTQGCITEIKFIQIFFLGVVMILHLQQLFHMV